MFIVVKNTPFTSYNQLDTLQEAKDRAMRLCTETGAIHHVLQVMGTASKESVVYKQAELPYNTIPTEVKV